VVLALVPKCPFCVAGYVLAVTGVGVSVGTAGTIRSVTIGACVATLGLLAVRAGARVTTRLWRAA
jgi:hypothetical protein